MSFRAIKVRSALSAVVGGQMKSKSEEVAGKPPADESLEEKLSRDLAAWRLVKEAIERAKRARP
jgi:hypothetical protein